MDILLLLLGVVGRWSVVVVLVEVVHNLLEVGTGSSHGDGLLFGRARAGGSVEGDDRRTLKHTSLQIG